MPKAIAVNTGARDSYREAIDATCLVVGQRSAAYRNLVVVVSVLGIVAFGCAVWRRSGRPFALASMLMPLCLGFLLHDRLLLNRWRARLLADWTAGTLDVRPLRAALLANPALPSATIAAMLESLPGAGDQRQERTMLFLMRESAAHAVTSTDRRHATRLAVAGVLASLAAAGCLWATLA